jgi:hypothetical protein
VGPDRDRQAVGYKPLGNLPVLARHQRCTLPGVGSLAVTSNWRPGATRDQPTLLTPTAPSAGAADDDAVVIGLNSDLLVALTGPSTARMALVVEGHQNRSIDQVW